jgi:zinc protease
VLRAGTARAGRASDVDAFLDARGASLEVEVQPDRMDVRASALTTTLPDVFCVFADLLRRPVFDADRLAVEASRYKGLVARQNDSPDSILFREFDKLILGPRSPYVRTATERTMGDITKEDLIAWHRKYFQPAGTYLAMWGDIGPAEAISLVKAHLGDWPQTSPRAGAARELPQVSPNAPSPGVFEVVKPALTQSSIRIGHPGSLRRTDGDFPAVEVLNKLLAGGSASRLYAALRSRQGLAYVVSGGVESHFVRPMPFSIWLTTRTETTGAAIRAALAELQALLTDRPPTAEEVSRAKEAILNSFVMRYESPEKIMTQWLELEYYGVDRRWLTEYPRRIEQVTPESVLAAARKRVIPGQMSVMVLGRGQDYDVPLSTFGAIHRLDPSQWSRWESARQP